MGRVGGTSDRNSTRIGYISIFAYFLLRLVKKYQTRDLIHVGFLWLGLTLLFEWGGSLAIGRPIEEILIGWNIFAGYMWPYVLLAYLLSNLTVGAILHPGKKRAAHVRENTMSKSDMNGSGEIKGSPWTFFLTTFGISWLIWLPGVLDALGTIDLQLSDITHGLLNIIGGLGPTVAGLGLLYHNFTMILFILLVIVAVIAAVTAWVELHEVVSEVKVLNPEGDKGTALVVYQKALRDFQPKVAFAFAEGLVSSGWRVEITTVSSRAPTDISSYDLLVLGWPTYWFNPPLPIRRYLKRIGDLERKSTVIICTAAGAPAGSCEKMKNLVQAANGTVVKYLTLFTIRPNEGNGDPLEIATQVGKEITLL